ncbi:TetR family transcriptional regulator [Lentzea atacamensis]|uniref:TetR family transcriptional regulator n=2 Tax=Lentzea TaxID=165301 RepID=A0A316HLJ9_9PSEU|nr:TetR/AcrR family transcriptional regulator [Lentzea atacamensis]PWK81184.1 TetR family transcriptional regulator [Lentzea atacamensis]RAS70760.1 TetR family transcriptional regulator [Lentzea atacamensis]
MTGLRERKKAATRVALGDAAWSLCVEHGYDGVTVEQIARAAGVSLRTFFNYFSSKEEAVMAGDTLMAEMFVREFENRPADEPVLVALREALHAMYPARVDLERLRQLRELRRHPAMLPHVLAAYAAREQELTAAIADRCGVDPAADPYPAVAASTILASLRAVVQWWLDTPSASERFTATELVGKMIDQLGAGFTR